MSVIIALEQELGTELEIVQILLPTVMEGLNLLFHCFKVMLFHFLPELF